MICLFLTALCSVLCRGLLVIAVYSSLACPVMILDLKRPIAVNSPEPVVMYVLGML